MRVPPMRLSPSLITTCAALALLATALPARADLCDFRPEKVIDDVADSALGDAIKGGVGFDLSDVVSGANLLNPERDKDRLKGVTGVVAAAFSAPVSVAAGVIGITAFEGVCTLHERRRTDSDAVFAVLSDMAEDADPAYFALVDADSGPDKAVLRLGDGQGGAAEYPVRRLEIVDGELRHISFGANKVLGRVTYRIPAETLLRPDEDHVLERPAGPAPLPEVTVSDLPQKPVKGGAKAKGEEDLPPAK